MLCGHHSRPFAYYIGEGCLFLAFLQYLADKRSPDRFVELLASQLTYRFLRTLSIEDLNFADSFFFCVSQLDSSLFSNYRYGCGPKHFIDGRGMSMNDKYSPTLEGKLSHVSLWREYAPEKDPNLRLTQLFHPQKPVTSAYYMTSQFVTGTKWLFGVPVTWCACNECAYNEDILAGESWYTRFCCL